jgi:hypothetical protein
MEQALTLQEAALVIRCSKAHLQNVVRGRVANVPALPASESAAACSSGGKRLIVGFALLRRSRKRRSKRDSIASMSGFNAL